MSNYGADALVFTSDKLTGNLADYDPLADVPAYLLAGVGLSGSLSDTQPVDEHPVNATGTAGASFRDDLYERVLALPSSIELGNLFANQVRTVELWNTNLTAADCSDLQGTDTEGLSLNVAAPFSLEALKSVLIDLSISTSGPVAIDGSYVFVFTDVSVSLTVTGQRLLVFPFTPEYPIEESLEWLTDVIESYDGSEQRIQIRSLPRQVISESFFLKGLDRIKSRIMLSDNQTRVFGVPVWYEARQTQVDIDGGSDTILVSTGYADFREGSTVLVWRSSDDFEVVEASSIASDSLSLARPIRSSFKAGTYVMPLRQARVQDSITMEDISGLYTRVDIDWSVIDNGSIDEKDLSLVYQGYGVFTDYKKINTDTAPRKINRPIELIDYESGLTAVESRMTYSRENSTKMPFQHTSRSEIWEFKRWLSALSGKLTPIWLPSFLPDITVCAAFNDVQLTLTIQNIGLTRVVEAGNPMYAHVLFRHTNGSIYAREIISVSENDDGTETMQINEALGFSGDSSSFEAVSFIRLCRQGSDRTEFSHERYDLASIELSFTGVNG
jgi:hypothetical protein